MGVQLPTSFPRMTYADAMEQYGCDKPDVRYDLRLHDVTAAVQDTSFRYASSGFALFLLVFAISNL